MQAIRQRATVLKYELQQKRDGRGGQDTEVLSQQLGGAQLQSRLQFVGRTLHCGEAEGTISRYVPERDQFVVEWDDGDDNVEEVPLCDIEEYLI